MAEIKRQLVDWLDDLCVRFIINLPKEELLQVERICFQVEEAQWYYEDFIRPLDPELPSLNLKKFCLLIFQRCPLLSQYSTHHHSTAFQEFLAYKTRVPVRGAILVNHDLDSVVLVRGWKKGASWSFPRGKINKDEPDLDCAIREVYEETGYNIREAGLVPQTEEAMFIEMSIRDQHVRLYIFRDVPMSTHFEPRTRKEIGKISWYKLSELPTQKKGKNSQQDGAATDLANHANRFYMVAPFVHGLKKWISQQKKLSKSLEAPKQILTHVPKTEIETKPSPNGAQSTDVSDITTTTFPTSQDNVRILDPNINTSVSSQNSMVRSESAEANLREQKSQSLLALLQGKPMNATSELPQTPAEQVIENPPMPTSPKRHPVKPKQRVHPSTLNVIHQAPVNGQRHGGEPLMSKPANREEFIFNALRTNQPNPKDSGDRADPVDLNPTITTKIPSTEQAKKAAFASLEQSSSFASAIPAASKLPPPKLTAQSSKLLELFKSNKPSQSAQESIPNTVATSHLSVGPNVGLPTDYCHRPDQASLEVSEVEDHHADRGIQSNRAPSEISFEMPADLEMGSVLPELTPPRAQMSAMQFSRDKLAAWQDFQSTDAEREIDERRQAVEMSAARAEEEARKGFKYEPEQPIFQETWKQVEIHDGDGRKVVNVTRPKTEPTAVKDQPIDDSIIRSKQDLDAHASHSTIPSKGTAVAISNELARDPSVVDAYYQRTALLVLDLDTEEAVWSIFPESDRVNILYIEAPDNGAPKYLVHFNTDKEATSAYDRQPWEHKRKYKYKPVYSNGQLQGKYRPYKVEKWRLSDLFKTGNIARATDIPSAAPGISTNGSQNLSGLAPTISTATKPVDQPIPTPSIDTLPPKKLTIQRTDHQNALLGLLKAPSTPVEAASPPTKSGLQAPVPSFELSAIPSPGHSREPSRQAAPLGVQPCGDMSHILPMSQPVVKRQKTTLTPRKSPVSATVDGPLNVPQFDLLAQKHHPAAKKAGPISKAEASRKSPITILPRPSTQQESSQSAHLDSQSAAQQVGIPPAHQTSAVETSTKETPSIFAIKDDKATQPTHIQPITVADTSSSGDAARAPQDAAASAVHSFKKSSTPTAPSFPAMHPPSQARRSTQLSMPPSQTIRRPPHIRPQAHDSAPSPISPLPSPQHSLAFDRRAQQTKEQKKSLLSLFDTPDSPRTSAISTGSPIAGKSAPGAMAPPPLPPARVDSTASALISPPAVQMGFGETTSLSRRGTDKSSGSGRTTPKDYQSVCHGFLDDIIKAGR